MPKSPKKEINPQSDSIRFIRTFLEPDQDTGIAGRRAKVSALRRVPEELVLFLL